MTHASLFSGIGAAELAAEWLGWENKFHCEIDDFCRTILKYHFPNEKSYNDIKLQDFSKWGGGQIDVLSGGFPCQPFSNAGRRLGAEDDRYLWPEFMRAITEIKPRWFVGENVGGILTMVQPGEIPYMEENPSLFQESDSTTSAQQFVVETICSDFEKLGYEIQTFLIPACAVGAPHRRDRVFFIANRTDTRTQNVQQERKDGVLSSLLITNPKSQQSNGHEFKITEFGISEQIQFGGGNSNDGSRIGLPQDQWRNFPLNEPAICRGNDGLPFDVDCLTIPFTEWRKRTIKAYGNAIVPQVIYEIFRAIQITENEQTNNHTSTGSISDPQ